VCEWRLWKFDCNFCRAGSHSQSSTVILLHLWSLCYTFFRAGMSCILICDALKICVSSYASWKRGNAPCFRFPLWNHRKLIDHCMKFVTYLWNVCKIFEPCKFWYVFVSSSYSRPNPSLYCNFFSMNILAMCSSFPQCCWQSRKYIYRAVYYILQFVCDLLNFFCWFGLNVLWVIKLIIRHLSLVDHVYNKICHNMFSVMALLGHVCSSYYFG
jgi:hypothetical protein